MRHKLKREIKLTFEAPTPARKESFLCQFDYPRASQFDFIKAQLGYIRKRVWILSLLLFIVTLFELHFYGVSTSFVRIMSSILPFISLISISEIARSTTHNMEELEMSCKHNFLEIFFIRAGILGTGNLIFLLSILFLLVGETDFAFFRLGLFLTTPYLLNCYISLIVLNCLKSRDITYICGIVTAFVSISNALITIQINDIYTEKYWTLWITSFIVLTILSAIELVKLIKKMEEFKWNSSLTV